MDTVISSFPLPSVHRPTLASIITFEIELPGQELCTALVLKLKFIGCGQIPKILKLHNTKDVSCDATYSLNFPACTGYILITPSKADTPSDLRTTVSKLSIKRVSVKS